MADDQRLSPTVKFGEFELDLDQLTLMRDGELVKMSAQPLRLLALLAARPGEIVSHEEIYKHLWGEQIIDHSGSVHVCIRQIRTALGDNVAKPLYIENIPRRGYRFKIPKSDGRAARPGTFAASGRENRKTLSGWTLPQTIRRHFFPGLLAITLLAGFVVAIAVGMEAVTVRLEKTATAVSPARDAFLRGKYLLDQRHKESIEESRKFFRQAIEIDSGFAPAFSAMAESFQWSGDFENSRTYAEKAAALDPKLADAQLRLGAVHFFRDWNWTEAERHINAALVLDPNFIEAHHAIATVHAVTGRLDSSLRHMKTAMSLDPASTLLRADYGYFFYYAGKYDAAIKQCRDALALDASDDAAALCIVKAANQSGDHATAIRYAADYMQKLNADESTIDRLTASTTRDGLRIFTRWRLREAEKAANLANVSVSTIDRAFAENALGNHNAAIALLNLAFEERSPVLPVILLDPEFIPLREDPNFRALLAKLRVTIATHNSM